MASSKNKGAQKLSMGMKCRDCIHFKTGPKSPLYKNRCSELGVKAFARACQGFTPDFTQLNRRQGGLRAASRIAKIVGELNGTQTRILGYLLTKMTASFEKVGVHFGQKMYIFLEPTIGLGKSALVALRDTNFNYVENYYAAYVLGVTDLGDGLKEVYLASSIEGKPDYYVSVNVKEGERFKRALTETEFETTRASLLEQGRKAMPKVLRKRLERMHEMAIIEPTQDQQRTIEDIPHSWWESGVSPEEKRNRRNKGVKISLAKKKKFKQVTVEKELNLSRKPKSTIKRKKLRGRLKIKLTS